MAEAQEIAPTPKRAGRKPASEAKASVKSPRPRGRPKKAASDFAESIELANAAVEQRDGIRLVNQSISTIDQMTQQNAALVEESTAAAASLQEQAQRLTDKVAVFNTETATAA